MDWYAAVPGATKTAAGGRASPTRLPVRPYRDQRRAVAAACGRLDKDRVVIDRFDVWRHSAHAVFVDRDGTLRVVTARSLQGDRPWTYSPIARRQVLAPRDAADPRDEQGDAGASDEAETGATD